jgi:hypothetical protein
VYNNLIGIKVGLTASECQCHTENLSLSSIVVQGFLRKARKRTQKNYERQSRIEEEEEEKPQKTYFYNVRCYNSFTFYLAKNILVI